MANELVQKLASFIGQCRRIVTIATKPSRKEYFDLGKVVAAGVAVLGLIGFVLYLLFNLLIFRTAA